MLTLTSDQVLAIAREAVREALGTPDDSGVTLRDVVVKPDRHEVLMTVVCAEQTWQAVQPALHAALAAAGAETVSVRFRAADPAAAATAAADAATPHAEQPVRGHGAGLEAVPLLSEQSGCTFIAVASGKGGVGKSTVTVNLAVALARQGRRVGIIDADIYGFSVPDMMGIEERPLVVDERVIPIEKFGVKVISMGFFVQDNEPIVWRGPMLGKMLRNFFQEIAWGELDYLLLDLPPGTGDVALDVHQIIPHSKEIIVTTPHATAAFVAARAGAMAMKTNHEIIGVVENMAYFVTRQGDIEYVFGRGGGAKLAEQLRVELIGQIPLGAPDNHISEPDFAPSVYKQDSETGRLYDAMALRVIADCESLKGDNDR